MKKALLGIGIAAAAFAGVFLALRVDRAITTGEVISKLEGGKFVDVTPAQLQPGAPFDFRAAAKKIIPSVVSVTKVEEGTDWFGRSFQTMGSGSGVLISNDGYIVTNNHVVQGAASLTIKTSDGKSHVAKVIGTDPRSDVAVIKAEGSFKEADLGDSGKVEIGQWVMAVGNPLGYDHTLSVGVVSSLNRTLRAGENNSVLSDSIQTDASINQGNSGGALTDDRGRLIGINTAIATPSGGSVGIGFAIPVNRVKSVTKDLIKNGRVPYGWTGFDLFELPVSDSRVRRLYRRISETAPPAEGLVITEVHPGGPAAASAIQKFSIIIAANGKKIADPIEWTKMLLDLRVGDKMAVTVWFEGKSRTVDLKLVDQS